MTKQLYKGPPTGMLPSSDNVPLRGWRYREPEVFGGPNKDPHYVFWHTINNEPDQFGATYPTKVISLWWNGARWVVWITNLFVGESTEFRDVNDPPMDWAESMYILVNK